MAFEMALQHRAQVEEFRRKHRTGLLTLVFTDIVGSTALKQRLGEREAASLFQDYRELVRRQRARFSESEEIETAGDSFLLVFTRPSEAVEFALILQTELGTWSQTRGIQLRTPTAWLALGTPTPSGRRPNFLNLAPITFVFRFQPLGTSYSQVIPAAQSKFGILPPSAE